MSDLLKPGLDLTEAEEKLKEFDRKIEETAKKGNDITELVEEKSKFTFNKVVTMARAGWSVVDSVFQLMGIEMGEQMRFIIQAGFSTISFLTPLLTASGATPNPADWARAAFGLVNLGLASGALAQSLVGQQELSRQTTQTSQAIFNVGTLLGTMSFM